MSDFFCFFLFRVYLFLVHKLIFQIISYLKYIVNWTINKLPLLHNLYLGAKHFPLFSQRPFYIRVSLTVLWHPFLVLGGFKVVSDLGHFYNINILNIWHVKVQFLNVSGFLVSCIQIVTVPDIMVTSVVHEDLTDWFNKPGSAVTIPKMK